MPAQRQSDLSLISIIVTDNGFMELWKLKTHRPVLIRPIRPDDELLMVKFHGMLSADSVYFRYLGPLKLSQRIEHQRLIKVCLNDYDHELAFVAETKHPDTGEIQIVGVGRLIKYQEMHEAEFAVIVADAFHGSGLGTHLLRRLVQIAKREGCSRIVGYILPGNRPMLHICEKLGFRRIHPLGDPVVKVELDLSPAVPPKPKGN